MSRRRDLRPRAFTVAVLSIGLVAAAVHGLPDRGTPSAVDAEPVAVSSPEPDRDSELAQRFRQGVMMLHAHRYDYAVVALRRVLALRPDLPEAHVNMGFALLGMAQPDAAREFFLSAIDLRPGQTNAYWGLAVAQERLCDLKGARAAMQTYLHLASPEDRFSRRAGAAVWEWSATLADAREGAAHSGGCGLAAMDAGLTAEAD